VTDWRLVMLFANLGIV